MTQGLKNLQESAAYKRTTENIQFAKEIAKEKTSGMVANITASGYFQSMSSALGAAKTKISSSMSQNLSMTFSRRVMVNNHQLQVQLLRKQNSLVQPFQILIYTNCIVNCGTVCLGQLILQYFYMH